MQKKNFIPWIIVAILTIALAVSVFLLFQNKAPVSQPEIEQEQTLKVVSHVKLKTWTKDGAIVIMDDSSSFAQLNVFVPKEYLDNQYVGGDYLSVYHNGVIKDGTTAEFEKIYKVETYHIESVSLYNEWDVNPPIDITNTTFTEQIWPAVLQTYTGSEDSIQPKAILAISRSYTPTYAVLCSINHGGDRNSLSIYYVQLSEGKGFVVMTDSVLVGLDRLSVD